MKIPRTIFRLFFQISIVTLAVTNLAFASIGGPEIFTDPIPVIVEPLSPDQDNQSDQRPKKQDGWGADLIPSTQALASRIYTEWRYFYSNSCELAENCVRHPGWRRLLRFNSRTINQGNTDFFLGNPNDPENAPYFEFSPCHGHKHLKYWTSYSLLELDGSVVIPERDQSVCVSDITRIFGSLPGKYHCGYQGITAGWADDFPDSLQCQWVDITGVPPGSYLLQVKVNPRSIYKEKNYFNNTALLRIFLQ